VGRREDLRRHLVCLDGETGRIVWNTAVDAARLDHGYAGFLHEHGYASSTPASDGERIYVYFGNSGAYAFDLNGTQVWRADCGEQEHGFGSGASPILFEDLLLVNASIESRRLVALHKQTGRVAWSADEIPDAWNTPALVEAGGRTEVVVPTRERILAFDAATGASLWHWEAGREKTYVCPSLVCDAGILYGMPSHRGPLVAVRPGGQGDIGGTHAVWRSSSSFRTTVVSPVCTGELVFCPQDTEGTMACFNQRTGEELRRIRPEPHWANLYASPLLAEGRLYVVSRLEGVYVFEATREMRQIARNRIANDPSQFNASPAPMNGRLLLRSDRALYCVGE
jgi:hypothetical protein